MSISVVIIIHLPPQNPHTPLYKTPIISMSFFVPIIISVYFSHFFNLKKNLKRQNPSQKHSEK